MENEDRDPCGFVTNPPSVVVRVVGTGRNDFNGLLGIVTSFNVERGRYLVHMTKSQSTMALKQDHLVKANFFQSYRAQLEQLQNDARVREKMSKYLNLCRKSVAPLKLSHVVVGVGLIFFLLIYFVGFLKTVMTTSLLIILGIIILPELATGNTQPKAIMENFPERARTLFEKQLPFLRGRISNRMAVGAIVVLSAVCLQSLVAEGLGASLEYIAVAPQPKTPKVSAAKKQLYDLQTLETFYTLGYEDAAKGRQHGSSIQDKMKILESIMPGGMADLMEYDDEEEEEEEYEEMTYVTRRRRPTIKGLWSQSASLKNVGSFFFLYRSVIDLGTDQSTSLFSVGQLAANVQHHTEWWRKTLLILSIYNVIRIFF